MDTKEAMKLLGIEPKMDPIEVYVRVGRIIETMPLLNSETVTAQSADLLQWLGEACAIAELVDLSAGIEMKIAVDKLTAHVGMGGFSINHFIAAVRSIPVIIYRVLAKAELKVPPEYRGSFIPAQSPVAALAAFTKIFKQAKRSILIVDPFLDGNALSDFAITADEGISIQLLAGKAGVKEGLRPQVKRWLKKYTTTRPLEVRLADDFLLHDRVIILDSEQVWSATQSLNTFASRSPATLVRFHDEGNLKRSSYEQFWTNAVPF
jgi:hypothetical protein